MRWCKECEKDRDGAVEGSQRSEEKVGTESGPGRVSWAGGDASTKKVDFLIAFKTSKRSAHHLRQPLALHPHATDDSLLLSGEELPSVPAPVLLLMVSFKGGQKVLLQR